MVQYDTEWYNMIQNGTELYRKVQYDGEHDRDQDSEIIPCVEEDECVCVLMERELHGGECVRNFRYSTVQNSMIQNGTAWYRVVQCDTEWYSVVQNGTV